MKIFVDADACPKVIKEILFRAAIREEILTILIANQRLDIPRSPFIKMQKVGQGFDVADDEIIRQVSAGDLVITADIPLADGAIKKGATALGPRGNLYTEENIKQRLAMRDLMETLRDTGTITGGPSTLSQSDRKEFAGHLDRILNQKK